MCYIHDVRVCVCVCCLHACACGCMHVCVCVYMRLCSFLVCVCLVCSSQDSVFMIIWLIHFQIMDNCCLAIFN